MANKIKILFIFLVLFSISDLRSPISVYAADATSTNFISRDAVISTGGTYATSSSYQLILTEGQMVTGTSSSASYSANSGFLFYPYSTLPVLSGTAGDGQVVLSWTAPNTYLGYNISAYEVGRAIVSGGPYTYSNVGNVLASTRTGLTNGTAYYFIVRGLDFYGDSFATSTEVAKTPVAATVVAVSTPSGGGGGGGGILSAPVATTTKTVSPEKTLKGGGIKTGDLNGDNKVDIKDFSILAYWFKRPSSAVFAEKEKSVLGGNGTVTLRDFSILAYHWSR